MKFCMQVAIIMAAILIGRATPALAFDDDATDAAFAALLSLPQAQPPDASWEVTRPEDFDGQDEAALIAWLAEQRKAGANFNQVEHQGTLLLHALRSNLRQTALWLLRHGADPTLRVTDNTDPPLDALGLAIRQRDWSIVDAILPLPAFKKLSAQELGSRYFPFAPEAFDALRKRGFALPEGAMGDCFLEYALRRGLIELALALPSRTPLCYGQGHPAPQNTGWITACTDYGQPRPGVMTKHFSDFDTQALTRLDAKLTEPLLAYLIASLRSAQDVDALFRLPLRQPADPAALKSMLLPWLAPHDPSVWQSDAQFLPNAVHQALAERLSPAALAALFDDPVVVQSWLQVAARKPGDEFAWALAKVPDAALAAHGAAAAKALSFSNNGSVVWPLLLARTSLHLGGDDVPGLLAQVPITSWPALFARGYRPAGKKPAGYEAYAETDIDNWFSRASLEQLREGWPLLAAADPSLLDEGVEQLLRSYAPSGVQVCDENAGINVMELDRLDVLLQGGARVRQPIVLSATCAKYGKPELYARLLATGAAKAADPTRAKRYAVAKTQCRFSADPAWLQALATRALGGADSSPPVPISDVQLVDYPGEDACALIVAGGNDASRIDYDDESFFDGPIHNRPCGGETLASELWRLRDGRILSTRVPTSVNGGVVQLRDISDDRRYLFARGTGGSTCSTGVPARLLGWDGKDASLNELSPDTPAARAYALDCETGDTAACPRERANDVAADSSSTPAAVDVLRTRDEFVDTTFAAQRLAYLDAVIKLDKARLVTIEQQGVLAHWTLAAIEAVSKADLPLPEKRRRTAWLFRDATRLRAALSLSNYEAVDPIVLGLATWLPREDWPPVLAALKSAADTDAGDPLMHLKMLADRAKDKGDAVLACRFLRASGQRCAKSADTQAH